MFLHYISLQGIHKPIIILIVKKRQFAQREICFVTEAGAKCEKCRENL